MIAAAPIEAGFASVVANGTSKPGIIGGKE
jgi:hypothetical protein